MRCKYCNIEVTCESKICPLCHEKLVIPDNLDLTYESPKAYPDKQKPTRKAKTIRNKALYQYCFDGIAFKRAYKFVDNAASILVCDSSGTRHIRLYLGRQHHSFQQRHWDQNLLARRGHTGRAFDNQLSS